MSCFLFADEDDVVQKINIDELYDRKQQRDQRQLSVFNKLLNRVHKRIQTVSRAKRDETHIWYSVPSFVFGEPLYDQTDCIAYIVTKLADNGFYVKFIHPSTLFVSWDNWVPSYMRQEIKKKTGLILDEKGNVVDKLEKKETETDANSLPLNDPRNISEIPVKETKKYTPINQYKPTGNLVYGDAYEKLEKRVSFK